MRTLQEKYNAIQEGKFSKEHFLAEARMQQPQLVTRFNGYDDAVQILKNRGMIVEANLGHNEISSIHQEGGSWIVTYRKDGTKEKVFKTEKEARDFEKTLSEARRKGVVKEAGGHASINNLSKFHGITGDKLPEDKEGLEKALKAAEEGGNKRTAQEIRIALKKLNEARLTKNNLTDYRYKPTNEMDKYPYEQILRGLRVELEVMEVQGTPSAEEYAKALSKVSKNLAKDSIFYTNQLAGVNPKVDQHDQMVDATAKNTVDTFNGMKKAELKEGVVKKAMSKGYTREQVEEALARDKAIKSAMSEGEKEYDNRNLYIPRLKEGNRLLVDMGDGTQEIVTVARTFIMSPPKGQREFVFTSKEYGEDMRFTSDMVIDNLKEDHSKNPNDKYVVRPCKNKKEPWAVWEGEKRVKGFATKEEAKEYADKQNKKQGLTESVLKEGFKKLIKKVLSEEVIDVESYKEDVYEMYGDEDESKELPKEIPGFEGTRDELDDLFESKSLKDLL